MTGQRFGRWLVLGFSHVNASGSPYWLCRCDCGNEVTTRGSYLRAGESTQCKACRQKALNKVNTKHGQSETRRKRASKEYVAWASMISRCERPTYKGFARYGGRDIKVCERWRDSFDNFLTDMGRKPTSQHSLDRYPNNDGNYEPGNCRWATPKEQANNRLNPWIKRRKQANAV
jgi:hypothetical protein